MAVKYVCDTVYRGVIVNVEYLEKSKINKWVLLLTKHGYHGYHGQKIK